MAYHDCSLRHQWRRYYHDWYQRTGDELRFSPGFWTDLWALFSMEVRLASIIGAYFVFEIVYVFAFACFLWLIGGVKPTSFTRCTLASARTVTMLGNWEPKQFDFVGGGEEAVSAAGARRRGQV